MGKPFLTVRFDKTPKTPPKGAAKPAPKPMPLVKPSKTAPAKPPLKATAAEAAAIDRGNRAQARDAAAMRASAKKAPQVISTTVRERTTPAKKRP